MAELADHAAPVVRALTCLHLHQATRLRGQKAQHLPGQLLAERDRFVHARAVELKTLFRQIDTDDVDCFHGYFLPV